MSWTKLTEDKATWPEDGHICWLKLARDPDNCCSDFPWRFESEPYGRPTFWDYSGGMKASFVTHWHPATPPQFEEEG